GVGVENGITPCRLSACSMLSSVEATLVGGLLPLFSQYRTERGGHPAARARSACVSPASIRAARIWRPETMLLITRLYIRFWKRHHRPMPMISWVSDESDSQRESRQGGAESSLGTKVVGIVTTPKSVLIGTVAARLRCTESQRKPRACRGFR